ncbi:MAG: hypothetical protein M1376_02725 [Planctomycetes bacterium]|nr:hypothetical protein [Planctomycetota bacterium]
MYRHINRNVEPVLVLLRKQNHVRDYDNLMDDFAKTNVANDRQFQKNYVGFWRLQGVNNAWRQNYFNLLQTIKSRGDLDLQQQPQLLRHVCNETRGTRGGKESLEFVFATKLVHMVDPTSPVYDDRVRAFYFLPDLSNGGGFERRIPLCLEAYNFLVREYDRIIKNGLLCHSIHRFREELHPDEKFTDVKIIDSLIWAFVTWADQRPAFATGGLQYE